MLKFILGFSFFLSTLMTVQAQDFRVKYEETLSHGKTNNLAQIYRLASSGNTFDFVKLSYVVDANNTMYEATSDTKFLRYNLKIVEYLLNAGVKDARNRKLTYSRRWYAKIGKHQSNAHMNNKEFILFEGYLFRHIAKFAYLLERDNLFTSVDRSLVMAFAQENFLKVYYESLQTYGDLSELFSIRTHMGSHWAMMAIYLNKLPIADENRIIYGKVISGYNQALRINMKLKKQGELFYYVWHSTYDVPFTVLQKQRIKDKRDGDEIQDVSHGNQVVEYIVSSSDLGYAEWSTDDMQYLINTLTYKIWKSGGFFAENINGSLVNYKGDKGAGYKQSMGWMKLMNYGKDDVLFQMYKNFYNINRVFIDSSYLNLQYYANFVKYKSNK